MLKTLKDLSKDTMTYGFASVLGQIIGFVLLPLYTSYLTTEDYGVMAMLTFVSMFFAPLANMGVTNAIFRRFNLHKDLAQQITTLSIGSIFVLATSILWLILGFFFSEYFTVLLVNDLIYEPLVKLSFITAFFVSMGQVFTVVLRAERKVTQIATVKIVELLITVGFTIYFVVFGQLGVLGVIQAGLIGAIFGCVVQYLLCIKLIKLRIDFVELGALLNYGLPFLPHRLIAYGSGFLTQYFIKEFVGLSETGLYNIAYRFTLPLIFVISSVQSAWVPIKFQTHREEGEKSAGIFRQLISFYFIIIALIFAGCLTVGPELLRLMTHSDFHDAVYLLPLVLLIPISQGIYFMMGTGFEFTDDTKPMPFISGAGLFVLFVIGYFSFDYFGVYGIILGLIGSWLTMAFAMRRFAIKRFYVPINFSVIYSVILFTVVLSFVVYSVQGANSITRIGVEGVLGVVSLFVIAFAFVTSNDLKTLNLSKYPLFAKFNTVLIPFFRTVKSLSSK